MDKNNIVDNGIENDDVGAKGDRRRTPCVYRSHREMVDFVADIYKRLGHTEYHNNKAIATVAELSPSSIKGNYIRVGTRSLI